MSDEAALAVFRVSLDFRVNQDGRGDRETVDGDHGRIETRRVWCTSDTDWFQEKGLWKGLASFGMVECERVVGEKTSVERRYFISSLAGDSAEQFGDPLAAYQHSVTLRMARPPLLSAT